MDLDAIEAAARTAEAPVVTVKEWRRARDLLMTSAPEMVAEIRRLRANHAEMVARNQLLRNRPDLPIERVQGYDAVIAETQRLQAENKRLRRFVTDQGTTCYSCESCGHARTTRECLRCEVKELRALCGDAADAIRTLEDTPHFIATEHENLRSRLRAASKGEA